MTATVRCNNGKFEAESVNKYNTTQRVYAVSKNQESLKTQLCMSGYSVFQSSVSPILVNTDYLFIPINNPLGADYRSSWWGYTHFGEIVDYIVCNN